MEISIEYHYISDYIYSFISNLFEIDEETNDTKPIVTSHVNSNQKGKNHDVLKMMIKLIIR